MAATQREVYINCVKLMGAFYGVGVSVWLEAIVKKGLGPRLGRGQGAIRGENTRRIREGFLT